MTRSRLTRIAVAAAVVLLTIAGVAGANRYLRTHNRKLTLLAGCEKKVDVKLDLVSLKSMAIKKPVYGINNADKFFKFDLSDESRTTISSHDFHATWHEIDYGAVVKRSADGRWISYSHEAGVDHVVQYWLYDTRLGTDHLLYQATAWNAGQPVLSPDGSLLAIEPEFGTRQADFDSGIYLFDTATLQRTRITLPTKRPFNEVTATPHWSDDGKELLIRLQDHTGKGINDEAYSWHVSEKRVERLADIPNNGEHFSRQGVDIPMAPDLGPQSDNWVEAASTPAGTWNAQIRHPDDQGRLSLKVQAKDGTTKTVFSVPYEKCDFPQLGTPAVAGWLDERHLVFSDSLPGNFYVYDTATGNIALLFDGAEDTRIFTW